MGVDASAHLIYGIDLGDITPPGFKDHCELIEWIDSGKGDLHLDYASYYWGKKIIIGVKGHKHTSDYKPIEITSLNVDLEAVENFKKALIANGIENPKPRWLLTDDVTF